MSTEKRPKVSVLMITYNHEKYIEQAVRSVMMQETDFDYELVIGEDCSTDSTREILLRLKEEFPSKIRLILQPQNLGMAKNFVSVYGECNGEYIALIEGDDAWISNNKLATQLEYMKTHKTCRLSFHSATIRNEVSGDVSVTDFNKSGQCEIDTPLFDPTRFVTASAMFLKPSDPLPIWMLGLIHSLDWVLYNWLLSHGGKVHFLLGDPHSLYRIHTGGVTFQGDTNAILRRRRAALNDMEIVCRNIQFSKPQLVVLNRHRSNLHRIISSCLLSKDAIREGRLHALIALWFALRSKSVRMISMKYLVLSYLPKLKNCRSLVYHKLLAPMRDKT